MGEHAVRLKSLTLNGFKSFPDRTRLEFGAGVSVVVGPNGSGKSNVTDAVLWVLGEQSPLAVRGQSMQDVIFGGGRGVQPRSHAKVEIVLDNSDGSVEMPLSEISIVRRLDRNGEGGYRLNGARCRLTDVLEVLSDTGLGKENHSVVSQGRVEAIVTSRPRERRLLIEEAAGLGKHRKRRRRAQLKLERTQENLDRALDVEREARSRLRPLKRQAEAAELHERLQRQIMQARLELVREAVRASGVELAGAEERAAQARDARTALEQRLAEVVERRGAAERALAGRAERHEALASLLYRTRSAHERMSLRAEQARSSEQALLARLRAAERELHARASQEAPPEGAPDDAQGALPTGLERIATLEAELAQMHATHEQEIERELTDLRAEHERQIALVGQSERELTEMREAREDADVRAERARAEVTRAERATQHARRESERIGAELAAANQFLRAHTRVGADPEGAPKSLSDELRVQDGYELALAAALGGRLDAALVNDVASAEALLDGVGPDGGSALLAKAPTRAEGSEHEGVGSAPVAGARKLLELLSGPPSALELAARLLDGAWVVERLEELPREFSGIAVTRGGRVWFAAWGEVRQLSEGGSERVLARRNERDRLLAALERAAAAEQEARASSEGALGELDAAEQARLQAEAAVRGAERQHAELSEARRRSEWLIEQRRAAPAQGERAVRQAELEGELAAERRQRERRERERAELQERLERLRRRRDADGACVPRAQRLASVIEALAAAVTGRVGELEASLASDRSEGEQMAHALRTCAAEEAEIQTQLRACGEIVTQTALAAQRLRDQLAEVEREYTELAAQLGLGPARGSLQAPDTSGPPDASEAPEPSGPHEQAPARHEPLGEEEAQSLRVRVERLGRRREQLGPVNPLAQEEYAQARAHVEELEGQRDDLETALRELRAVIRETDRQIQETFEQTFAAAARGFEELAGELFPGGRGRLRLVKEETAPRRLLGGQPHPDDGPAAGAEALEAAAEAESEAEQAGAHEEQLPGVEIEITPAGKATKRLSLLSGGEKSMTALAFLFAVFLARPCPFYILDEVEAALDELNLERFLALLRRYGDRAQFIVITHQKRTMEAADYLYGVSMGQDGVSKVLSRRLPADERARERITRGGPGHAESAEPVAEVA